MSHPGAFRPHRVKRGIVSPPPHFLPHPSSFTAPPKRMGLYEKEGARRRASIGGNVTPGESETGTLPARCPPRCCSTCASDARRRRPRRRPPRGCPRELPLPRKRGESRGTPVAGRPIKVEGDPDATFTVARIRSAHFAGTNVGNVVGGAICR